MIMKNKWIMALVCVGMCALVACKDSKKEPATPDQPQTEDIYGNKSCPAWVVSNDYDYTTSMTAVIKVGTLNGKTIGESDIKVGDVMAAFSGDKCLGVDTLKEESIFYLYIIGAEGDVTLRYYSSHYKNIFEQEAAFPFKNDDSRGTFSDPFKTTMVVKK